MRLSTPKHHDQFLKTLAEQMGCEAVVALDYLLWEVRRQGFSFAHPLPLPTQPVMQTPVPVGVFTPFQEVMPQPQSQLQHEPDEFISRLLALGIEEF